MATGVNLMAPSRWCRSALHSGVPRQVLSSDTSTPDQSSGPRIVARSQGRSHCRGYPHMSVIGVLSDMPDPLQSTVVARDEAARLQSLVSRGEAVR